MCKMLFFRSSLWRYRTRMFSEMSLFTISKAVTIDKSINLCLNGHKILQTDTNDSIFQVNGGSLTLTDCSTSVRYGYWDGDS